MRLRIKLLLLTLTCLLLGCGAMFDRFRYMGGQSYKRIKLPDFGVFPMSFDVSKRGDIYFSLHNKNNITICRLNIESEKLEGLISTKSSASFPVLSNNEKKLAYLTGHPFYSKILSIYDIEEKYHYEIKETKNIALGEVKFSLKDDKIFFIGESINKDSLDLQNYRLSYYDIYEYDITKKTVNRLTHLNLANTPKIHVSNDGKNLILQVYEYESQMWELRFEQLNLPIREPYLGPLYSLDIETGLLKQWPFNWTDNELPISWQFSALSENRKSIYLKKQFDGEIYRLDIDSKKIQSVADSVNGKHFRNAPESVKYGSFKLWKNDQIIVGVKKGGERGQQYSSFVIHDLLTNEIEKIYIDSNKIKLLGDFK